MKLYEDSDIAQKIHSMWKRASDVQRDWRKEAGEDFDFAAGHQWSEADETKLNNEGRPIITFNRCNAVLSAVLGLEANQRQQVTYLPREIGDSIISKAIDDAADWARDYGEMELEESQVFESMLTCGMGWSHTYMDYDTDLDGKIIQEVIPYSEMRWDTTARKRNLIDARWKARGKKMSIDEIKERWPGAEINMTEDWLSDNPREGEPGYTPPGESYSEASVMGTKDTVLPTVIHFQWYENKPIYRIAHPETGKIIEIPTSEYEKNKELIDSTTKSVKQNKRIYYEAFVLGEELLEKGELPCQNGMTFKCVTGKRDEGKNSWYGIVRMMKDPQRWANKFFSTFIDIIDSNAKGGLMVEEGAVADQRGFEESWAKADSIAWLRSGAIANGRVQNKPTPNYPQATDRLLQFSIQSIYDVTGVNVEMLGMADRAQPGVVEESRKRSAYTILASFFDSMRMYRKQAGIILLEYIQKYIPTDRIADVLEDDLKQYAQMIKEVDLKQMNVIVSESPVSDNHKSIVWNFIAQVLPALLKMGVPVPPDIFDYSPLPAPLVQKWKAMLSPGQNGQASPEQQVQMLQQQLQQMQQALQQFQAENQKLKNQENVKMAELSSKRELSGAELQLEREKAQADIAIEQQKLKNEFEAKIAQIQAESEIKIMQFQQELQAKREMHMAEVSKDLYIESQRDDGNEEGESKKEEGATMEKMVGMMGEMMIKMAESISAPKKVIRDNTGRIAGVETLS